jgi:hypothetical protein
VPLAVEAATGRKKEVIVVVHNVVVFEDERKAIVEMQEQIAK